MGIPKFREMKARSADFLTRSLNQLPGDQTLPLSERVRLPLMIAGPVLLLIVGVFYYVASGRYVSTDDAYVQVGRTSISVNAPARVVEVLVKDNQYVKRGDVLFRMGPEQYLIALKEAEAQLASSRLNVGVLKATYRQRQADLIATQETLAFQQREFARQKNLLSSGISSKSQYDQALHAVETARQQLSSMQQQLASALANLGGDADIEVDDHPSVQDALAKVERAKLYVSYMTVRAPQDGVVTQVDQLQPGDYVNAGVPVFSLVAVDEIWVEANFKETDLTHIRPGQRAAVDIDAYSGHDLEGVVETLSPGTGSFFSLLPPQNASGNWVKVVQRVPVRIKLRDADAALALHAGLSAHVSVDIGYQLPFLSEDKPQKQAEANTSARSSDEVLIK